MPYYLSEINERCRKDAKAFIEDCDSMYQKRLEKAADRIADNLSKSPVVLLSGPSGSGKTTTAMKICEVLEARAYALTASPWIITLKTSIPTRLLKRIRASMIWSLPTAWI